MDLTGQLPRKLVLSSVGAFSAFLLFSVFILSNPTPDRTLKSYAFTERLLSAERDLAYQATRLHGMRNVDEIDKQLKLIDTRTEYLNALYEQLKSLSLDDAVNGGKEAGIATIQAATLRHELINQLAKLSVSLSRKLTQFNATSEFLTSYTPNQPQIQNWFLPDISTAAQRAQLSVLSNITDYQAISSEEASLYLAQLNYLYNGETPEHAQQLVTHFQQTGSELLEITQSLGHLQQQLATQTSLNALNKLHDLLRNQYQINEMQNFHLILAGLMAIALFITFLVAALWQYRHTELRTRDDSLRLKTLIEQFPSGIIIEDKQGNVILANQRVYQLFGLQIQRESSLQNPTPERYQPLINHIHFSAGQAEASQLNQLKTDEPLKLRDGRIIKCDVIPAVHLGSTVGRMLQFQDITDVHRADTLIRSQKSILEQATRGTPLPNLIQNLCQLLQQHIDGCRCQITIINNQNQTFEEVVPLNTTDVHKQSLIAIPIREGLRSAETAAIVGKPVYVADVRISSLWEGYRDTASKQGIIAAWSIPYFNRHKVVRGTLSLCFNHPREPHPHEEEVIASTATMIGLVFERYESLRLLSEEKERAQVTLDSIGDAVISTNAEGIVQYFNPIAEKLTGLQQQQTIGKPLDECLNLYDEKSGLPVDTKVHQCLKNHEEIDDQEIVLLRNTSGQEFAVEQTITPIRNRKGVVSGAVMVLHDVSEARQLAEQIAYQASHDWLTGLVNRREFEKRLQRAIESAQERNVDHALCYLDLDRFKIVNDTVGHAAGDALLRQLSQMLQNRVRGRDTLARLGGDEFSLILENCPMEQAEKIAAELVDTLKSFRFTWEERTFAIGVSVGLVPITPSVQDVNQLMRQADIACYTAKDQGRGRVHIHHPDDEELARRHREVQRASSLGEALKYERFELHCQPIYQLNKNGSTPASYEMLLRLKEANGSLILPNAFIPAAERYDLMNQIDRWVINKALRWVTEQEAHPTISINLSGQTINDPKLAEYVKRKLSDYALSGDVISFEIAEKAAVANLGQVMPTLASLKDLGCQFSLDDFGTGLSSFSYLKSLPVDYLKIDGNFVQTICQDNTDRSMVEAINNVGHAMGLQTVAEFIEDTRTYTVLQEIGVDYGQGYNLGKPLPLSTVKAA